ncbi:hypothetical protein DFH09DRAFT_1365723 [Mycena vulgaris]|nr:hypothetical protein DFH09DRAFT_1365723 [Mycena vulgaris]
MSAVSAGSQEEVSHTLIPSIAAKLEPTDGDSLLGGSSQDQEDGDEPVARPGVGSEAPVQEVVDVIQAPEIIAPPLELPGAALQTVIPELDPDAGSATTPSVFQTAFPLLSPVLEPIGEPYVEPPYLRPLSDDEDDLPTLQNLLAETHPEYELHRSSQERVTTSPRSSRSPPVKSEVKGSRIKLQSDDPINLSASAPPHRPKTPPPTRIFIDISDSSPLQPPKTQNLKSQPSPSPFESKPLSSQARPKRKHTPSLPPASTETPPSKRSKTVSAPGRPALKHNVHWALDGSIVIQIQDIKFKLHQSQLAKHSTWFSDLFEDKKVEGRKHVERGEDGTTPMYVLTLPTLTAKDFARLLDGFDSAITYVHEDPSFTRMAGILRAATILSFADFRDWAIRLLEDKWSPSISDLSPTPIGHATESVILARACEVPTILKRSMYELVRLSGYGQTEREGVSARDFRALVKAREELTSSWLMTMSPYSPELIHCASIAAADPFAAAPPPAVPCTTLDPLQSNKAHHKLVRESGIAEDYLYDPLCGLQALIDADWAAEEYCVECVRLRREVWANRREKVWDNLNIWFGLAA